MTEQATDHASLWAWLVNVDPFVRRLSVVLVVVGLAVMALTPLLGLPVVLAGPAAVRWSKPDAVARWQERRAVQAAMADLEARHEAGHLTDEAFGRRRAWLVSTAAV